MAEEMKTRVRPHYDNRLIGRSSYYVVQYKTKWFMPWRTLRTVFTDVECSPRSDRRFPVLVGFDEACRIASTLTEKRLAELNAERVAQWQKYKADLAEYRKTLPRTVTFDVTR